MPGRTRRRLPAVHRVTPTERAADPEAQSNPPAPPRGRRRTLLLPAAAWLAGLALLLALAAPAQARRHRSAWVQVHLLAFNDFHGALDARRQDGRPVGGAAVLAAWLKAAQAQAHGAAIIAQAGDLVGASPPDSALLQDEPSVSFLNRLANAKCRYVDRLNPGCDVVGTLGNHEFDEGVAELMRLLHGGNYRTGPFLKSPWRGARYPTVCANVVDATTGKPLFPPFVIKSVAGVRIGFVGAVLRDTPNKVMPSGVASVRFTDEADAINAQVRALHAQGVHAIVALIHQGTLQEPYSGPTRDTLNTTLRGPVWEIVRRLVDVDVVLSGHTHAFTNALMPDARGQPVLVTQAFSMGTAYADVTLALSRSTGRVESKSARIVTTWGDEGPGRHPDPAVAKLVAAADAAVAPRINRPVGRSAATVPRRENESGESPLGDLVADAQRAALGTDFAFANPGGIRAGLPAGQVTWGDLFTVQPFGNRLVRLQMTGAQVLALLEQQWEGPGYPRILQVSGLHYIWDDRRGVGHRVVQVTTADGKPIDSQRVYSVAVNSFLADGGDHFPLLGKIQQRHVAGSDLEALVHYVKGLPQPFRVTTDGRIVRRG